jgi:4-hydroxybenzoate polyprenyltransferase
MDTLERLAKVATRSRLVEFVFAGGLPIIGYCLAIATVSELEAIWLMMLVTGLTGFHILAFNDACFKPGRNIRNLLGMHIVGLGMLYVVVWQQGHHAAVIALALMVVNWDLYAWAGKRHWFPSILHHCIGGALHVGAGYLFASSDWRSAAMYGLYFGLAMAGAAMHHEAIDIDEDRDGGYRTGAVRFGMRWWFFCGAIPMTVAHLILTREGTIFETTMVSAFLCYGILLVLFAARGINHQHAMVFRMCCRITYGIAGAVYLYLRVRGL